MQNVPRMHEEMTDTEERMRDFTVPELSFSFFFRQFSRNIYISGHRMLASVFFSFFTGTSITRVICKILSLRKNLVSVCIIPPSLQKCYMHRL